MFLLTLIMDEFGLPALNLGTFTHSNQRIFEKSGGLSGPMRGVNNTRSIRTNCLNPHRKTKNKTITGKTDKTPEKPAIDATRTSDSHNPVAYSG
jgi:hypothetical protein